MKTKIKNTQLPISIDGVDTVKLGVSPYGASAISLKSPSQQKNEDS